MKNKRKLFLPLVLVLIIIGISYVTYYGGIEKRKKVITSGAISMMYVESSNIISINKAIPTIDKTGKVKINKGEYFDFEVAAATKVNMNINYEITVKDVTSSSGKKIDSNHIKLYLTKLDSNNDEKIVMSPQKYKIITSANTKTGRPAGVMSLTKKTMSSSDTVKYRLRMYVDETYNVKKNDDNSSFSVEVNVYGKMKEATSGGKLKAYMTENDWKNNKTPSTDFHTDYYREKITSIITKRNNEVPTTVLEKWDLSEKQDSSIIAYIEDDGTGNNTYKLTIGGKDGIIANESMIYYFNGFSKALSMDLSAFDTLKVTDMSEMFSNCSSLISLDLSNFNTKKVTDMNNMFSNCYSLSNLDVSNFHTTKVVDMSYMFSSCIKLSNINLSSFNTSKVKTMHGMFFNCKSLKSLNLSNFDTSKVIDMNYMFLKCGNLDNLDFRKATFNKETKHIAIFSKVPSNITIITKNEKTKNWLKDKIKSDNITIA